MLLIWLQFCLLATFPSLAKLIRCDLNARNKHCSVPKIKQEAFNTMPLSASAAHISFFIFEQVHWQNLHHGCLTSRGVLTSNLTGLWGML